MSKRMQVRAFLEFKDGTFGGTEEVLQHPDVWGDLTAGSRRLVKRYSAALANSVYRLTADEKDE